jgi:hypothetical protein
MATALKNASQDSSDKDVPAYDLSTSRHLFCVRLVTDLRDLQFAGQTSPIRQNISRNMGNLRRMHRKRAVYWADRIPFAPDILPNLRSPQCRRRCLWGEFWQHRVAKTKRRARQLPHSPLSGENRNRDSAWVGSSNPKFNNLFIKA